MHTKATRRWNHNSAYYPWVAKVTAGCRRVLDVGCGDGEFALMLARKGHEVVGIDVSSVCIERARKKCEGTSARFQCRAFGSLTKDDGTFDAIVFVASLHHMTMRDALEKAKDLLSPSGVTAVVGLAAPSSVADCIVEALRVVPSWMSSRLHRMRSSEELGIPTSYDLPPMDYVREMATRELTGSSIRYGIHWRYLLFWRN